MRADENRKLIEDMPEKQISVAAKELHMATNAELTIQSAPLSVTKEKKAERKLLG